MINSIKTIAKLRQSANKGSILVSMVATTCVCALIIGSTFGNIPKNLVNKTGTTQSLFVMKDNSKTKSTILTTNIVKVSTKTITAQEIAENRKRLAAESLKNIASSRVQEERMIMTSRGSVTLVPSEREILERIVMEEAGYEPYEGQIAIANVVLNRVRSKDFPNTISGVVFQKNQFTPVSSKRLWSMTPTDSVKKAVNEALNGRQVVGTNVYWFLNRKIATDHWIERNRTLSVQIGRHSFYK